MEGNVRNMNDYIMDYILVRSAGNLYWKNTEGKYLGCNNNMANVCRLKSPKDIVGKTDYDLFSSLLTEVQIRAIQSADLEVIRLGVDKIVEETGVDADGNVAHYLSCKIPLMDSANTVVGLVGTSIDITKQKRAELVKKEFLENMRHDIRTPLAGIVGSAQILKEESKEPKTQEYVDSLVTSSNALSEFLNGILETARVGSGEIPLVKHKFDLKKCLTHMVDLNQAKAQQKDLDLQFDYDAAIPNYLLGDSKRVQRIALELITNALNFTHTGCIKVSVQLAQKQGRAYIIKIIVTDTGIGIPPEQQQEIFTRFKRLTPSYEGTYNGAGLGLSIVKQFIHDLDAEIYVQSEVSKGAVFTCIIPMKKALLNEALGAETIIPSIPLNVTPIQHNKIQQAARSAGNVKPKGLIRVLLVEDHAIAAKMASYVLESLNCHIDHAPNGQTAITLAGQHRYDLIFMDVGLPDISGLEVTQHIRLNAAANMPIIALTAHVDGDDKQHCIDAGMNAVLCKPLIKEKAEDILNAFIPHRQNVQEAKQKIEPKNPINSKAIDLDAARQTMGNKDAIIIEMLEMLKDSLPEEVKQLQAAYKKEDWAAIQALAHRIKGGCNYCGTMRLQKICASLESSIKSKKIEMAAQFYRQMLAEFKAIEEAINTKDY
jgi:two-component system aerobic respiration control sensor histidine kinase ArcB